MVLAVDRFEPKNLLQASNPQAIRILVDPDAAEWLKPFIRQPVSVKVAAEEMKVSVQAMHYRVQRMASAGLLKVVSIERRRGRPVKRYRSVARVFRVPLQRVPPALLEALEHGVPWHRLLQRGAKRVLHPSLYPDELLIGMDEDGVLNFDFGPRLGRMHLDPSAPPVLGLHTAGLWLNWVDAKALQREIDALWERYRHRRGAKRYVFVVGLAPYPED